MSAQGRASEGCPADVLDGIAWYPEQLSDAQRGRVEAHAAECLACRRELALVQGIDAEVESAVPDADAMYARVRARIEAGEDVSVVPRVAAARVAQPARAPGRRSRIASGGQLRGWALAASLLLAVAAGYGLATLLPGSPVVYGTAREAPVEAAPAGPRLEVVFRSEASIARVSEALRAMGARIVAGPSKLGVFTLELPAEADPGAAAKLLRDEGSGVATFAEPSQPGRR